MISGILFAVLSAVALTITNEEKQDTEETETNTYNSKAEKIHNIRFRLENMTNEELNKELAYYDWFRDYGTYSREYKIDKLVEKMGNRL